MHRIVWYKIGGRRLHLLKMGGAFILLTAILKVFEAAYDVFVTVSKIQAASANPELVPVLLGWTINANALLTGSAVSYEDAVGALLGPFANFFFWMGMAVLSIMLYQAGKVIFPVEEWQENAQEHHRKLLSAVAKHHHKLGGKKKKKKR